MVYGVRAKNTVESLCVLSLSALSSNSLFSSNTSLLVLVMSLLFLSFSFSSSSVSPDKSGNEWEPILSRFCRR